MDGGALALLLGAAALGWSALSGKGGGPSASIAQLPDDYVLVPAGVLANLSSYTPSSFSTYLTGDRALLAVEALRVREQWSPTATITPINWLAWKVGTVAEATPPVGLAGAFAQFPRDQQLVLVQVADQPGWQVASLLSSADMTERAQTTRGWSVPLAAAVPWVAASWNKVWPWKNARPAGFDGWTPDKPFTGDLPYHGGKLEGLPHLYRWNLGARTNRLGLCVWPPARFTSLEQAHVWMLHWWTWRYGSANLPNGGPHRSEASGSLEFMTPTLRALLGPLRMPELDELEPDAFNAVLNGAQPDWPALNLPELVSADPGPSIMLPWKGAAKWHPGPVLPGQAPTQQSLAGWYLLTCATLAHMGAPGMKAPTPPRATFPVATQFSFLAGIGKFLEDNGPALLAGLAGGAGGVAKGVLAAAIQAGSELAGELQAGAVAGAQLPWDDSWSPVPVPRSVLGVSVPNRWEGVVAEDLQKPAGVAMTGATLATKLWRGI